MLDHARRTAMNADVTEPAQQMQVIAQQWAQFIFHCQAILQQHHLGARCSSLGNQRRQLGIGRGLGTDQQPVARWHLVDMLVGLYRRLVQCAMYRAVQLQASLDHRAVLAAQQKCTS